MNTYLQTLDNDINRIQDLSHACRGEWCRNLESEADSLQSEVIDMKIHEGDFEKPLMEKMSFKLRDAYRHLTPNIHI